HAHRLYQDFTDRATPDHDLEREYRDMLAAEPTNPTLQYLLGRVAADPAEATRLYESATSADKPEPLAFRGAAYVALAEGRAENALRAPESAAARGAPAEGLKSLQAEALEMLARYDEILKLEPFSRGTASLSAGEFAEALGLMAAAGRVDAGQT